MKSVQYSYSNGLMLLSIRYSVTPCAKSPSIGDVKERLRTVTNRLRELGEEMSCLGRTSSFAASTATRLYTQIQKKQLAEDS